MTRKIMIVDDDPDVTKFLDIMFRHNGFETCIATDGKVAMDVFLKEKPDLITLDLEMPEEWGPRFFRKISKAKGFNTPVIVISGVSGREFSIPKAKAFFAKPFNADEVLKKAKEILSE